MKAYLKLFWIFIKAQFSRIFLRRLKVSFKKVYGDWYCDIKGWPEKFFPNSLMVADASRLIQHMSDGKDYVTFVILAAINLNNKLCPILYGVNFMNFSHFCFTFHTYFRITISC